jgi:hypothetical protein
MEEAPANQGVAHDSTLARAPKRSLEARARVELERERRIARGEPESVNPATYAQLWEQTQQRWVQLSSPGSTPMALPLAGQDGWLFRDAYRRWEQIVRWRRSPEAQFRKVARGFVRWPDPRKLSPQSRGAGAWNILGWLLRNDARFEMRANDGRILVRARQLAGEGDHCVRCGALLEQPKTGRRKRYHSERCRRAAELDLRRTTRALQRMAAADSGPVSKRASGLPRMEESATLCRVCRAAPAWRARRCRACYAWWDRHGREQERPGRLLERAERRRTGELRARLIEEADRYIDRDEDLPEGLRQALAQVPEA